MCFAKSRKRQSRTNSVKSVGLWAAGSGGESGQQGYYFDGYVPAEAIFSTLLRDTKSLFSPTGNNDTRPLLQCSVGKVTVKVSILTTIDCCSASYW